MISLRCDITKGIEEQQIVNIQAYENIPYNLTCYICRKVVNSPVECTSCHSIYCFTCWNTNHQSKTKCIMNCNSSVIKADEVILLELSKLKIKCLTCDNTIDYMAYNGHFKECYMNHLEEERNDEINKASKQNDNPLMLKSQIQGEELISIQKSKSLKRNILQFNGKSQLSNIDKSNKKNTRKYLMTYTLSPKDKMKIYNAVIAGDLAKLKNLIINEQMPLFEEISTEGYHWSALHYAMHNGKLEIIYYIFDTLIEQGVLELALECETNDARCPLLCLLNSDKLNLKEKREIFVKLMHNYDLKIPDRIYRACKKRGYLECLSIIKSKSMNKITKKDCKEF